MEKVTKELNEQFTEFLQTKGIKAKFSLAFENIKESAKAQHQKDVANFKAIKEKSIEENKDFYEFLKTKGIKAKYKLVVENIKKGARESREKTKEQIEKGKQLGKPNLNVSPVKSDYSADELTKEFNEFLKMKGLDSKYTVSVVEE